MAVISAIRKRTGLVLTLIAVAIIGFLLMDMLQGNSRIGGSSETTLGKVAGQKIDRMEFFNMENALYSGASADVYARREYLWSFFTERAILEKEAEKIGLRVEKNELMEVQFGTNLANIITARFSNPATGGADMEQLNSIKSAIERNDLPPNLRPFWAAQEKEVIKERLETKLANLVSKAIFSPAWMAEMEVADNNTKVDFEYAFIPYDQIDDASIEVTDKDLDDYIQRNKERFRQKLETRIIDYIVMDVIPSGTDSARILKEVEILAEGLANAENDTLFLETNLGVMESAFMKKEELPATAAEEIAALSKGGVFGPFLNENTYAVAKMLDKKMIPDSVKSRHILLRVNSEQEFASANARIDSIKTAIENKEATFEQMAMQFSTDGSAQSGGDLGYAAQGMMVKPFNDMIFFGAEPGELKVVYTQFGIHLVEVTDRKYINKEMGYRLGIITREIAPGEETQKELEDMAYDLLNKAKNLDQLKEAIKGTDLRLASSSPVNRNAFKISAISEDDNVREVIRWAFASGRKTGDVSGEVYSIGAKNSYYTSKYIIAGLKSIIPAGLPKGANIRSEIEAQVRLEKKFNIIAEKIQGKSVQDAASAYSTETGNVEGATFVNTFIEGVGNEPNPVATAIGLTPNKTSKPIKGNAGAFVVKSLNKTSAETVFDASFIRNMTQMSARRQMEFAVMPSLVNKYEIKDNRFATF
jgi:peptidyl-prolyl cis-trans isomerase D